MGAGANDNIRGEMDGRSLYEEGNALYKQGKCEEACAKYEAAAQQGYAPAQYTLGIRYHSGIGVAQDHEKAFHWWKMAAEQGYVKAQVLTALCKTMEKRYIGIKGRRSKAMSPLNINLAPAMKTVRA